MVHKRPSPGDRSATGSPCVTSPHDRQCTRGGRCGNQDCYGEFGGVVPRLPRSSRDQRLSTHRVRPDVQMGVEDADGPLSNAELLGLSRLMDKPILSWTSSSTGGSSEDSAPCSSMSRLARPMSPVRSTQRFGCRPMTTLIEQYPDALAPGRPVIRVSASPDRPGARRSHGSATSQAVLTVDAVYGLRLLLKNGILAARVASDVAVTDVVTLPRVAVPANGPV